MLPSRSANTSASSDKLLAIKGVFFAVWPHLAGKRDWSDTLGVWHDNIDRLSTAHFLHGLSVMKRQTGDPPTPGQFREWCLSAYVEPIRTMTGKPWEDEIAFSYCADCKERHEGYRVDACTHCGGGYWKHVVKRPLHMPENHQPPLGFWDKGIAR